MVLPNVTQLYFEGKIMQDATVQEDDLSQKIYDILMKPSVSDLQTELEKANLTIDDDMVLLKTGQRLIDQKKADKALLLYVYYTTAFPEIVVAWNDLGDVYQMLGNREEALRCYKQALKLRPGNPRAAENIQKLSNGP
jgi:tetratricopeptide (TPR) repeat protein